MKTRKKWPVSVFSNSDDNFFIVFFEHFNFDFIFIFIIFTLVDCFFFSCPLSACSLQDSPGLQAVSPVSGKYSHIFSLPLSLSGHSSTWIRPEPRLPWPHRRWRRWPSRSSSTIFCPACPYSLKTNCSSADKRDSAEKEGDRKLLFSRPPFPYTHFILNFGLKLWIPPPDFQIFRKEKFFQFRFRFPPEFCVTETTEPFK